MDINKALQSFSALSQQTRLDVFRLLVKAGEQGMLAGEIGAALDVKQNTMSANLSVLTQASILKNARQGRHMIYKVDFEHLTNLLSFLLEDCCGGTEDLCQPLIQSLLNSCCNPKETEHS